MKRKIFCLTLALLAFAGFCYAQDAVLEPLFGFWKFEAEGSGDEASYYVLNVYSPENSAVKGYYEGILDNGTSRQIWAYYDIETQNYRLIDKVSPVNITIWEFEISGTTARGYCYHNQQKYNAEGMKLGTRNPNYPPSVPSDPTPIEGAYNLPGSSVTLEWECRDADNDSSITYDVYLGISEDPPLVMQDITINSATFESLRPATIYSWKIVATDELQGTTEGPVWHFTTVESISETPGTDPEPDDEKKKCLASRLLNDDRKSLDVLRRFRDRKMMQTPAGRVLVKFYYKTGPTVSKLIENNPEIKEKMGGMLKTLIPLIQVMNQQ